MHKQTEIELSKGSQRLYKVGSRHITVDGSILHAIETTSACRFPREADESNENVQMNRVSNSLAGYLSNWQVTDDKYLS